jgi:molybdopterin synthase sulfur carrier subunit
MIDEQNRIRRHIRFFSGNTQVFDLDHALPAAEELIIVQALSGG